MPSPLYFDAARMGRMTPSTQQALIDFVRFAGENGCTLYFDELFQHGFDAWPERLQRTYAGLKSWDGIKGLKRTLSNLVGLSQAQPILVSRSANLVRAVAKRLFLAGKTALLTDLTWPSYGKILRRAARRLGGQIRMLNIRERITRRHWSARQVVATILEAARGCQGVFLPHVSHDGICLPLVEIRESLDHSALLVADGAQALGHVPIDLTNFKRTIFLGGVHKWIGGYLPLGVGFYAAQNAPMSPPLPHLKDPLLRFIEGQSNRFAETVNVTPLFSCRAALSDDQSVAKRFQGRLSNAGRIREVLRGSAWQAVTAPESFCSGILLVSSGHASIRAMSAAALRTAFFERGLALTCYDQGLVRLSMPETPIPANQVDLLVSVFRMIARGSGCRKKAGLVHGAPF